MVKLAQVLHRQVSEPPEFDRRQHRADVLQRLQERAANAGQRQFAPIRNGARLRANQLLLQRWRVTPRESVRLSQKWSLLVHVDDAVVVLAVRLGDVQ
jgi:hypothetical protein